MRKQVKKILLLIFKKSTILMKFYKNSSFIRTPLGISIINFLFQRILRINGDTPIPVNFTSRVVSFKNISLHTDKSTKLSFAVSGGIYIQAVNGIKIGENFLFAPGIKIISSNHDFLSRGKSVESKPIIIGSDVWLGANVVILPGVELADGAIVGAGSIVTKSFTQKNSVIAGNPAKLIRVY